MTINSSNRGFFRSAIDALIAARQRQAERYVSNLLLSFDDKTLAASGHDRADLKKRARGGY